MDPTEVEPHTSTLVTGYVVRVGPKVHFDFNLSRQFLEASTDHHQIYHSLANVNLYLPFQKKQSRQSCSTTATQSRAGHHHGWKPMPVSVGPVNACARVPLVKSFHVSTW